MTGPTAGDGEVRDLLGRWRDHADVRARDEVVTRMLPLARSLARRYANRGEPLDDLEQVACVGLMKAIDRFDVTREVRFSTYAVPTIAGELKRHFRDRGWMMRVPREVQDLNGRLAGLREGLGAALGRSPTVGELAAAAEVDEERVLDALAAAQAYRTLSLDQPRSDGSEPLDAIGGEDHGFERAEARAMLAAGLDALPERQREIVRLSFCEGLTQREIAGHMGISQMHVSRLIRRSVVELRARIAVPQAA